MSRRSESINPLGKVGYNRCVVCRYCNENYLVRTIGNHWCYCKAYTSQCLGDDETKKVEEEKKKRSECTERHQQSNHGNKQQIMCGYKK